MPMTKRFEGKVALVTGGTSGLGQDAALAFAREGAKVVVCGRKPEPGAATVALIRDQGGEGHFVQADVSSPDSAEAMVRACLDTYGRLDCAYNNAGIDGVPNVPTGEYDVGVWNQVIGTNLTGVFLSMKYELQAMVKQGRGAIVNNSAVAAFKASKVVGSAYIASKHGVNGLTRTAALEYADKGIRINAVCPAMIRTPMSDRSLLKNEALLQRALSMHPVGRIGTPAEVTALVLFLCSDEASFMTGTAIPVDGGFLC
jgi:NAD(P)-dependent dehydrogenase (short-subunit alcohol dehydrogenase family)